MRSRLLGTGLAAAVVSVAAAFTIGRTDRSENEPPARAHRLIAIEGLKTSIVKDGRVRLRAKAGSLELTRPRLLGPLRIGFLTSVAARDVEVEVFDADGGDGPTHADAVQPLGEAIAALMPNGTRATIARVEVSGVRLVRHLRGEPDFGLVAKECVTGLGSTTVTCQDGILSTKGQETAFEEAQLDRDAWKVVRRSRKQ
jgi:hypothetical protein